MTDFDADELKKLSPERRLKVLKELEEKSRKEIEEARKLMVESEREIEIKEEIERDMPIPQLASVDIDSLFTSEEKEIFKAKRFVSDRRSENEGGAPAGKGAEGKTLEDIEFRRRRGALEEVLDKDNLQRSMDEAQHQTQYTAKLEGMKDRVYQLQTMAETEPARFMKYESKYKEELEMIKNDWERMDQKYKTAGESLHEEASMSKQIDKLLHWYAR
ncbi:hypothetical protein COV19_00160 [Candidatus Woesearchaeota archaeon CG10_big_fil_rev_8_21_14_0_10_44_13]|nr:MAG: hypothetical protein COV19_00160 [Candidatus Woesearchaeota archaeon CG10_big_fil_rev_8_21_14_0_10_44_13]